MNLEKNLIIEIKEKYNSAILNIEQSAEYLNLEVNEIKALVETGALTPLLPNLLKFKAEELVKFILGDFANIPCKNPTSALQSIPFQFMNNEYEEENLMASVYFNTTQQKWQYAFYQADGKRKILSAQTKEEVIEKARKHLAESQPAVPEQAPSYLTFGAVYAEHMQLWQAKQRADITKLRKAQIFNTYILPKFEHRLINEIKAHELQEFLTEISVYNNRKRSQSSIKKIYTNLKTVFSYALAEEYIKKNPFYHIEMPKGTPTDKSRKYFSREELVGHLTDIRGNQKYYLIAILLLATGIRPEELLVLRWSNIDLDNKTMKITNAQIKKFNPNKNDKSSYIYEEGPTKNKTSMRTIYLSDTAVSVLHRWKSLIDKSNISSLATENDTCDFVILNQNGIPYNYHILHKAYTRYYQRHLEFGCDLANFYKFRHSYATYSNALQIPESIISTQMGHSTQNGEALSITRSAYISNLPENYLQAAEKYNTFLVEIENEVLKKYTEHQQNLAA